MMNTIENIGCDKYEYVRMFEKDSKCLPNCWIVVRIDGIGFSRFSEIHNFYKPNDRRGLELMTQSACRVMEEFRDICLAYGQSDEYSFVFRKDTTMFNRETDRILSTVNSLFTSHYVMFWNQYMRGEKLQSAPHFDSRLLIYPTDQNLKDYLCWRQADLQINNLYNTALWALILKANYTKTKAQEFLKSTVPSQKHEALIQSFGIDYNGEPDVFKKGTVLVRKLVSALDDGKLKQYVIPLYCDLSDENFWKENTEILGLKSLHVYQHKPDSVVPEFLVTKTDSSSSNDDGVRMDLSA